MNKLFQVFLIGFMIFGFMVPKSQATINHLNNTDREILYKKIIAKMWETGASDLNLLGSWVSNKIKYKSHMMAFNPNAPKKNYTPLACIVGYLGLGYGQYAGACMDEKLTVYLLVGNTFSFEAGYSSSLLIGLYMGQEPEIYGNYNLKSLRLNFEPGIEGIYLKNTQQEIYLIGISNGQHWGLPLGNSNDLIVNIQ